MKTTRDVEYGNGQLRFILKTKRRAVVFAILTGWVDMAPKSRFGATVKSMLDPIAADISLHRPPRKDEEPPKGKCPYIDGPCVVSHQAAADPNRLFAALLSEGNGSDLMWLEMAEYLHGKDL